MYKYKSKALAREKADDLNLYYGTSVFDGYYYVGTQEQLTKIGVYRIESPTKNLQSS
jgi:hypothetical protein